MILNIFFRASFTKLLQSPTNAGACCMPAVSLFAKAQGQGLVDRVFLCYDQKVVAARRDSIGDEAESEESV